MSKLTAQMQLYRSKALPLVSFHPLVDDAETMALLNGGVVRVIDTNKDTVTHMLDKLPGQRTFSPNGTIGVSLRIFLFGHNIGYRSHASKSGLDYRREAFHLKQHPEMVNRLVCTYRAESSMDILGFRYYDVERIQCIDVTASTSTILDLMRQHNVEPTEKLVNFVTKSLTSAVKKAQSLAKPPVKERKPRTASKPVTTKQATEVVKNNFQMQVKDSAGVTQMEITKPINVSADMPKLDMEVDIPIPHTGLSISVRIRT